MNCAASRVVRVLLIASAVTGGSVAPPTPAAAQPVQTVAQSGQKRLLTLYSPRRDSQVVTVGDRVLQELVGQGLPEGLDYFSEALEQSRFFDVDYQRAFRDSLTLKYARYRFDVVVAVGEVPLEFVARNQDRLFKDVPIVYFVETAPSQPVPNSTGFVVEMDLAGTVRFARALQPELRHVFVVTSARGTFERTARTQLQPFESQLEVTYLSGLVTAALEARLQALPPQSMVLYVNVDRDGGGQNYRPLDYLDRVSAVANAPIYSWVDSAIGHGIVGGSLKSQPAEFNALGELSLRVLRGESPAAIPISSPDLNDRQVDWRQLRRWSISETRLPPHSTILFREPRPWELYRSYIIGGVLIMALQSALIAGLVVQRVRRRRTEVALRESERRFRVTAEQNQDLSGRLINAQEAERMRIARDLHDDVSQQLASVGIMLSGLKRKILKAVQDPDIDQAVAALQDRTTQLAETVRNTSHELHPSVLDHVGLAATLRRHCADLEANHRVKVIFSANDVDALKPDVALCLFRVAQEALTNALRHSNATTIRVELRATHEMVELSIQDDGIGFTRASGSGLGLRSIDERVRLVSGTLTVTSAPGQGTSVIVRIPVQGTI